MFQHLKEYVRPGAADKANVTTVESPAPAQLPPQKRMTLPAGDYRYSNYRNSSRPEMAKMKAEVSLGHMAQRQRVKLWISPTAPPGEGVVLKVAPGEFISYPRELKEKNDPFYHATIQLNAKVG